MLLTDGPRSRLGQHLAMIQPSEPLFISAAFLDFARDLDSLHELSRRWRSFGPVLPREGSDEGLFPQRDYVLSFAEQYRFGIDHGCLPSTRYIRCHRPEALLG